MKKIYDGEIPFKFFEKVEYEGKVFSEATWRQLDWYGSEKNVVLKKNLLFSAKIEILTYSRGRSAANWDAVLSSVSVDPEYAFLEGCKVNIFMVDMLDIILHNNLACGKSDRLRLSFCKRGANYGLCQIGEAG